MPASTSSLEFSHKGNVKAAHQCICFTAMAETLCLRQTVLSYLKLSVFEQSVCET